MFVVIDMEFAGLPWTPGADVFWVGLADERGRTFSAVNDDADLALVTDWSRANVVPRIDADVPRLARHDLAAAVRSWLGADVAEWWAWMPSVENIAYFDPPGSAEEWWQRVADWDFQLLRALVDPWPDGWASKCFDLHQLADDTGITLPPNDEAHHPGADAAWGASVLRLARQTGGRDG